MPRVARIVVPGLAHHVVQRGNNRQDVFFVDDDRVRYLEFLKQYADIHGLTVLGYCLMTNHVHLVVVPAGEASLAKAIGRTHHAYTLYVNRMHHRTGHLWQNRFYSCGLDEVHQWRALSYVERNPVRARMVRKAWRYPWSSAAPHIGEKDRSGLLDLDDWRAQWSPRRWQNELDAPEDERMVDHLRRSTFTGRPLATDGLMSKLEKRLNRRLRPLPVGRPRKKRSPERASRGRTRKKK
jgi:putative transposase